MSEIRVVLLLACVRDEMTRSDIHIGSLVDALSYSVPLCCRLAHRVCAALFNRIVGQQVAIVYDQPGVTRDR